MPLLEEWIIIRKLTEFVRSNRHCWLLLYWLVYIAAFFIIEANTPTEGYWVTDSPIDEAIPFLPSFAIFYVLWYPLFAAVGIPTLIKDPPAFKRWMYYNMLTLSVTLAFDVLFPNGQHLRPQDFEVNSLGTWIMSLVWAADTPTNVFPSMHVLGCIGDIVCVIESRVFNNRWRLVIIFLALMCSASTVFVKQHAWIDTVGAFAFAAPAFLIVYSRRFFKQDTVDA